MKRLVFALLTLLFTVGANAQTATIELNDTSAELGYGFLVGGSRFGRNELKTDFLFNNKETYLVDSSFQVFDEVGSKAPGLTAGVGGKLYGATMTKPNRNLLAAGVGGMLRYSLPKIKRLVFGVDGYYAPPILSFADAKYFFELAGRVQFDLLPTASVYVEYHQYTMNDKNVGKDVTLNNQVRLGLELSF